MSTFYKNFIIDEFETIDSTNKRAILYANQGKTHNHIILAKQQTAGRGRLDRSWESPLGNLYFSLLLRPKIAFKNIYQLSFLAVAALRIAIEDLARGKNIEIRNKWPNDLLINNRKFAGILLETRNIGEKTDFVAIGIGVNLITNPNNLRAVATNLKEFGVIVEPMFLLQKFLDEFENLYQNWLIFGFTKTRNLWLQRAYKLHEKISVHDGKNEFLGIFKKLDEEGNLVLEIEGITHKISAADVLL